MATKEQQYDGRIYTQAEVDAKVIEAKLQELENIEVHKAHPKHWVAQRREVLKAEKEQTNDQL